MALRDSALNIVINARDLTGNALNRLRRRLQDTDQAAARASTSLGDMVKRVAALAAAALGLSALTRAMTGMLRTGDEFERLGITMESLMGSIEEGQAATEWIKQFAQDTPHQVTEVTDAFIRLKGFGLDPMDGALQAMVDQNAKLGKGTENLTGITLALGQAWAKGKLQGEEIMQLVERGVPVWDLLSQATGKTTAELNGMSAAGALGRDVIGDLITVMGDQASGAAAKNMSLLSGYISNLKDEWALFQDAVAQSGALEFAKDRLKELLDTIQRMRSDGSLAVLAQQWSDGFVAVGQALKAVIVGIASMTTEIGLMARAFVALKLASWAGQLRGVTAGFVAVGAGAGAATTAIRAMTIALRVTLIGAAIELLGRLAGAYFDLQAAVAADEKSQKRWAATLASVNAKARENGRAIGLTIQNHHEWRQAVSEGVAVLDTSTGAWELNRLAAEALGYTLTAQAQQLSQLKQNAQALSEPYQALGNAFAEARASGEDFGEAMKMLLTTADGLGTEGIQALALQLKTLEQQGEATRDELINGLGAAIAELSDEDRAAFTEQLAEGLSDVEAAGADAVVRLSHMQTLLEANLVGAAAAMGISVQESLTGVDEATDAAVRKLRELVTAMAEAGTAGEDSSKLMAEGFDHVIDTLDSTEEIDAFTVELRRMADEGEISSNDLAVALEQVRLKTAELAAEAATSGEAVAGALDGAADAANAAGQSAQAGAGIGAAMAQVYEGVHAEIRELSAASVEAFEHLQGFGNLETDRPVGEMEALGASVEEAHAAIERMNDVGLGDVVGVTTWMKRLRVNAEETKLAFYDQQIQFEQLTSAWENGTLTAGQFIARAQSATENLGLLDEADLSALNAGIEQAQQNMEALKDSTKSTLETLQNELDRLEGNTSDIEKRQYEARRAELAGALEEANRYGDSTAVQQAREALSIADEIHRQKVASIREQATLERDRQNQQVLTDQGASEGQGANPRRAGPQAASTSSAAPSPEPGQKHTIELKLGGKTSTVSTDDPDALLELLSQAGTRTA